MMKAEAHTLWADVRFCLRPRCPQCRQGRLFRPWTITPVEHCAVCNARLDRHDIGDGAAVFLMFILCMTLVPMAWVFELLFEPALWVHMLVWTLVGLGMIGLMLPALKAYIIMLEFRHRPNKMGGGEAADKNGG